MTKPVISAEELEPGLLLNHKAYGEVEVARKPSSIRSTVLVNRWVAGPNKTLRQVKASVRRQDLSWQ